jgi:hypothetical protein
VLLWGLGVQIRISQYLQIMSLSRVLHYESPVLNLVNAGLEGRCPEMRA